MIITPMTDDECRALLLRGGMARLGCSLDGQPYIVPVFFAYEPDSVYVFATVGQKVEWMRQNPRVCVQLDEIESETQWRSVIATGTFEELPEEEGERDHARHLLEKRHSWWMNALAERRSHVQDLSIDPIFFCVRVESMSGLRAVDGGR